MKTPTMERRHYEFELREDGDGEGVLVGHAAVFDTPRLINSFFGSFTETVRKGAFKKTIKEGDVRALFNHDPNFVLGRSKAGVGNLEMREDKVGLSVKITPPDTTWARDLNVSIKRGDIDQMSFSFTVVKEQWETPEDGDDEIRELLEVKLWDVSPVTFPAYPETDVALRNRLDNVLVGTELRTQEFVELIERVRAGDELTEKEGELLGLIGDAWHIPRQGPAFYIDGERVAGGEAHTFHIVEGGERGAPPQHGAVISPERMRLDLLNRK